MAAEISAVEDLIDYQGEKRVIVISACILDRSQPVATGQGKDLHFNWFRTVLAQHPIEFGSIKLKS